MGRLFGTDGVRGVVNTDLTAELVVHIGKAAATVLTSKEKEHPVFLIGKDTRLSGDMLESALVAGLCSLGAHVKLLGAVPTPAVAYLVRRYKADAGIMISASHNPYEFNGIKIFSREGVKLSDETENRIEEIVLDGKQPYPMMIGDGVGRVEQLFDAIDSYIDYVVSTVENSLSGMKIALDCANGSSSVTAEKIFTRLGAQVHAVLRISRDLSDM